MKKILFGLAVFFVTLASAQIDPDYYPTSNNGYYDDYYDDAFYFPDDYYYEYPNDYYTNDYYVQNYNDYRRSINDINWNRFFMTYRLHPWQVQQIVLLNNMYPSFTSWNQYYRYNPDRWYYDRFYALERILGPQVFLIFQNSYYGGYNPVVYYQNYRINHYPMNVYIVPRYRRVNSKKYRVNRVQYQLGNPRTNIGFQPTPRVGTNNPRNNANGFQNNTTNGNVRNETIRKDQVMPVNPHNGGIRNNSLNNAQAPIRNNNDNIGPPSIRNNTKNNNSDSKMNATPRNNSIPNNKSETRTPNEMRNQKMDNPRQSAPNNSARMPQRFTSQ